MPYALPTVSQFKSQFARDFPYAVPAWGAQVTLTVASGVVTAAAVVSGGQGYKDLPTLTVADSEGAGCVLTPTISGGQLTGVVVTSGGTNYVEPTVTVSGGAGDETDLSRVTDADIQQAILDTSYNVSQGLFENQQKFQNAFNYLAAHNLVEKLLAAGEGLVSQYNWLTGSKSVGNMQEAFIVPDRISRDPMLSAYSKTRYGMMYLQIISPLLIGGVFTSFRRTMP